MSRKPMLALMATVWFALGGIQQHLGESDWWVWIAGGCLLMAAVIFEKPEGA